MPVMSRFGGLVDALSYAYGINPDAPAALQVITGSTTSGTYTITCQPQRSVNPDTATCIPATNTPITIGVGTTLETVTPSAVGFDTLGNILVTATFANAHGAGEQVRSGTVGLQEALNFCAGINGGQVLVKPQWFQFGGTNSIITSSSVPGNTSIWNTATGAFVGAANAPSSVTPLAAPTALSTSAATNGLITTAATGGTIASGTYRLGVTYVDAFGGETTLSIDTASTATIATSGSASTITITSPAAETGAVGYRVYMTAASGATLTEILYPVGNSAIVGTAVTIPTGAGTSALPAFQIGTPVTINAVITGTAKVPAQNSAYLYAPIIKNTASTATSYPPFTALGTIAAAATGTVGEINFPAGFFNTLGRTVRFKGTYYVTTNGTAGTVTTELILASVYGVTSITPFAAASSSIAASALTINFEFDITLVTAATGTTGNFECHGTVAYNVAGGSSPVGTIAMDAIQAVSSNLDLTKQNTLSIAHLNTTVGTTASQLRLLTIEVLQ